MFIMGMPVDSVGEPDLVSRIVFAIRNGEGGWVITANLDHLRQFSGSVELRSLFEQANVVVADGMPLVWASRLQGTPLPERVAGSDLVWSLTADAALAGGSIYLLGDEPGARQEAERVLKGTFPDVRIAGYSPPMGFENDPGEVERIIARLARFEPDVVFVALGFPKQERLIAAIRRAVPRAWYIGVGISLSFVGGRVRHAPPWVARIGLEWLYRLAQEPRRLARRYLVHGIPFGVRLLTHSVGIRMTQKRQAAATRARAAGGRRRMPTRGEELRSRFARSRK